MAGAPADQVHPAGPPPRQRPHRRPNRREVSHHHDRAHQVPAAGRLVEERRSRHRSSAPGPRPHPSVSLRKATGPRLTSPGLQIDLQLDATPDTLRSSRSSTPPTRRSASRRLLSRRAVPVRTEPAALASSRTPPASPAATGLRWLTGSATTRHPWRGSACRIGCGGCCGSSCTPGGPPPMCCTPWTPTPTPAPTPTPPAHPPPRRAPNPPGGSSTGSNPGAAPTGPPSHRSAPPTPPPWPPVRPRTSRTLQPPDRWAGPVVTGPSASYQGGRPGWAGQPPVGVLPG